MSSENLGDRSDTEIFFEYVAEYLWDKLSREELLLLLTEFLNKIEAEAGLSRKDVVALHKYLNELKGDLIGKDQETLTEWQMDRRRFLKKFPRVKQQLEERMGKLHKLADKVDKDHKEHTISNMAAHTAGAVSGAWTLLGLALPPVMGGQSGILGRWVRAGSSSCRDNCVHQLQGKRKQVSSRN